MTSTLGRALAASLLVAGFGAAPVCAGPITAGSWSAVTSPTQSGAFWSGTSWDCQTCGIGYVLAQQTGEDFSGLEYLGDGAGGSASFAWDGTPHASLVSSQTAWTNGQLTIDNAGVFHYDSFTGRRSDSLFSGWQYALFRLTEADDVRYFLGVEDMLLSNERTDRDYNDYVVTWTEPVPTPEPGTLLLLGTGLAILGRRKRRPSVHQVD